MNEPGSGAASVRMGENRRLYPRRKIERLAYVDFGPDNGGMLLDVGEGGLSFQGVGRVTQGEPLRLRFTLPGGGNRPIEVTAELVWSNTSGKGGGLRFTEITADARNQVRQWILGGPTATSDSARRPYGGTRPSALANPVIAADAEDFGNSPGVPIADTAEPGGAAAVPRTGEFPAPAAFASLTAADARSGIEQGVDGGGEGGSNQGAGSGVHTVRATPGETSSLPARDGSSENESEQNLLDRTNIIERNMREPNVVERHAPAHDSAGHNFDDHHFGEHHHFESAIHEALARSDDTFDEADEGFDTGFDDGFDNAPADPAETLGNTGGSAPAERRPIAEIWPDLAAHPPSHLAANDAATQAANGAVNEAASRAANGAANWGEDDGGDFVAAWGNPPVHEPATPVRPDHVEGIPLLPDIPTRANPARAAAAPWATDKTDASGFSGEAPRASATAAENSIFFGGPGAAAPVKAGGATALDDATADLDQRSRGFQPKSVLLNSEFAAPTPRNRRSSDRMENGESLITSVAVILASAGVAVLGVIIGLRIFTPTGGSEEAAGGSSSPLAKEMPAARSASPFEVNVVDAKNRRWVLGSAGAAESGAASVTTGAQPLPDAADPGEPGSDVAGDVAGNSTGGARENAATAVQGVPALPIPPPHSAQASRAATEMMAPSIEGLASDDSAARLPLIAGEASGPAPPPAPAPPRQTALSAGTAVAGATFPSANPPANRSAGTAPSSAGGATAAAPNGSSAPGTLGTAGTPGRPVTPSTSAAGDAAAANTATAGGVPGVGASRPSGFTGPVLISHLDPKYPAVARQQHAEGDVLVRVIIGKNGIPRQLQVVRGDVRLVPAALQVIPEWRYQPALLNGEPTDSQMVVTVSFRLR